MSATLSAASTSARSGSRLAGPKALDFRGPKVPEARRQLEVGRVHFRARGRPDLLWAQLAGRRVYPLPPASDHRSHHDQARRRNVPSCCWPPRLRRGIFSTRAATQGKYTVVVMILMLQKLKRKAVGLAPSSFFRRSSPLHVRGIWRRQT